MSWYEVLRVIYSIILQVAQLQALLRAKQKSQLIVPQQPAVIEK